MNIPVQTESKYIDRPEVEERFADSLEGLEYDVDSNVAKFTFSVKRGSTRLTACRVALPLSGLVSMSKALNEYLTMLEAQGLIRTVHISPGPASRN
jgi:hypothetical protein